MAQRGGEIAAKSAKLSGEDDRLSALPDDVLVLILLRLDDTAAAIRTGGLSRRWRRVWALLPELRFHFVPDGARIRGILDAPEAPPLRRVSVTTNGAGPESAAAWLPVAARRLSGELIYHNEMNDRDDEEAMVRGDLQLPCFKNATTIELNIGFLGLALPSQGIFAGLTKLFLSRVRFRSPSELGGVVSSPRCPFLKKFVVYNSRGLQNLSIYSESLLQLKLKGIHSLLHLTIVAPILQELGVADCILDRDPSELQLVANISAPQLFSLDWKDFYDPRFVHLGNLGQLQRLATMYFAYGNQYHRDHNSLRILHRFQMASLYSLHLLLIYPPDMDGLDQYLMGDITMLPQITSLHLTIVNVGHAHHAFGASSFHLLRMCTGLRLLYLSVEHTRLELEVRSTCPSGCICDQPMSWKTESLVLNHLHLVMIVGLHGADHEVTFVKQLFNWATVLKKMIIIFGYGTSESKAREFRQALAGSSRPETSVEFHMFRDKSRRSAYSLAPEGHGTM